MLWFIKFSSTSISIQQESTKKALQVFRAGYLIQGLATADGRAQKTKGKSIGNIKKSQQEATGGIERRSPGWGHWAGRGWTMGCLLWKVQSRLRWAAAARIVAGQWWRNTRLLPLLPLSCQGLHVRNPAGVSSRGADKSKSTGASGQRQRASRREAKDWIPGKPPRTSTHALPPWQPYSGPHWFHQPLHSVPASLNNVWTHRHIFSVQFDFHLVLLL